MTHINSLFISNISLESAHLLGFRSASGLNSLHLLQILLLFLLLLIILISELFVLILLNWLRHLLRHAEFCSVSILRLRMPTGAADGTRYSELTTTGCCESFVVDLNGLFCVVITPAALMADLLLDNRGLPIEISLRKRCCSLLLVLTPYTFFMDFFIHLEIHGALLLWVPVLCDSLVILLVELGFLVAWKLALKFVL